MTATAEYTARTAQDLLAERRANVLEQARERDATARAVLQFHIDTIDAELSRRRVAAQYEALEAKQGEAA